MWGEAVTVENHPGAGSTAGGALVAKSPADGYTLLVNTSAHAYSATFKSSLPYDPLKDFIPIAPITSQPYVLVAGNQAGVTTLAELLAAAKARPGAIKFSSSGRGTGTHVGVEKLNLDARIEAVHVPARGTDAIADTIGHTVAGRTDFAMSPIPTALPYIREQRLVALGVSTARRSRLLPEVPTLAEAGATGFDFPIWYGIWAPAGTPAGVVHKLSEDIARALTEPDLRDWLVEHDGDPMRYGAVGLREFRAERERERGADHRSRRSTSQIVPERQLRVGETVLPTTVVTGASSVDDREGLTATRPGASVRGGNLPRAPAWTAAAPHPASAEKGRRYRGHLGKVTYFTTRYRCHGSGTPFSSCSRRLRTSDRSRPRGPSPSS